MPQQVVRSILYQPFTTFVIAVAVTPTPIFPQQTKTDMIDSFVLSLDAAAANNVFIGDQGVTIASGLEIVAGGGPLNFVIRNQPMHYEVMYPTLEIAKTLQCQDTQGYGVPFVVWDLSQIYLVAAAATNIRCTPFRSQFI
ncbi:hypothetical protein L0244_38710 [bacterium]|nr:hypothetical protein [bacterium]